MPDIKFRCPECTQKIAVEASAAGVKIDCPSCHSRLVIPRSEVAPVEVLVKRKLAIIGGSADAVYSELQKAQAQAEKAADEIKQLRAQQAAAAQGARKDVEALLAAREAQEEEMKALRPLGEELEKARRSLAEAAEREVQFNVSAANAGALRAELTGLQATHAETQNHLATMTGQLGALQRERDEFAKAAAEAVVLRAELAALQPAHAGVQERLAAVTGQLDALQRECDGFRRECGELVKAAEEAALLRGQIAAAREEAERALSEARAGAEANRTLGAQLDAAKAAEVGARAELAAAQERITQLQKESEAQLAELAAKISTLEAERAQLTGIVEELLPLREELAKAQRDLCTICESTAEKARGHESQIEAAKNSEAELRTRLGDLQGQHATALRQINEHASRLEAAVKRVAELQSEAATAKSLREQFVNSQNELERVRRQVEESGEAARKTGEELAGAQAAEKSLREYSDTLQAKLIEAEKRHAGIASGFAALREERAELANDLSASWRQRDDALANCAGQREAAERLAAEVEAAKGEIARLGRAAEAAAAENSRLAAALEKAVAESSGLEVRCAQSDARAAASGIEAETFRQLAESAESAAKNRDTQIQLLTARTESLAALVAEHEAAARAAQERAQKMEDAPAGAAERARKNDEERAGTPVEPGLSKAQPAAANGSFSPPSEREKALAAERDALMAALERAKQHVSVLQARRDLLRDEVAALRGRLGIGGQVTAADEKPISK